MTCRPATGSWATAWCTARACAPAAPNGTQQKLLDVSKLADSGWRSRIGLREGFESTLAWFHEHEDALRCWVSRPPRR